MILDYNKLLGELSKIQEKMLLQHKDVAQIELQAFYQQLNDHFEHIVQKYKNAVKGHDTFLLKKQSQMILRYIKELSESNKNLLLLEDDEIILLFEKQYKMKKIIKKFASSYKILENF